MIKQIILFMLLLSSTLYTKAQNPQELSEFNMDEYTVKVKPNPDKTFGYEIFEFNKSIFKQNSNPFLSTGRGFKEKQNAMSIGILHIHKMKKGIYRGRSLDKESIKNYRLNISEL